MSYNITIDVDVDYSNIFRTKFYLGTYLLLRMVMLEKHKIGRGFTKSMERAIIIEFRTEIGP